MRKMLLLLLSSVLCGPADAEVRASDETPPGSMNVGVAARDVTPVFPVRLNGFGGRRKESEGVRQPLWAKALAVGSSEQDTVVVITVDTLGIPDDLTDRVVAKLADRGLDRSRLAICASHTHSGPMIRNCANTLFGTAIPEDHWNNILRYSDELEDNLVLVAREALADRRPSHLFFGMGRVGFALNRRTKDGLVDHDLPVLAVRDPDGSLRAVFANYACHCVTLSDDMISGDWAGYAMEHIQRRNPGCHALISIGCGADSNPRGGVLGSRFDVADSLGNELAEEVQRVLNGEMKPVTQPPVCRLERVNLPLAPLPEREVWEERAKADNAIGHHARTQLARLDRGEKLMTEISYPIQTTAFGDELAWVFLPGEVVVDYSLRLKKQLDGTRLWINAYANACPGYVPSERILQEGGYEGGGAMVYYDIPAAYAPGLEDSIVNVVTKHLSPNYSAAADVSDDAPGTNGVRPRTPSQAVSSLRTLPDFQAELAVAEPLIQSPVAIAFGPDGRLWVAEMNDYPQGRPEGEGGQIRCVYDDNADGRYDRSEIFLTGIPFPTGVTVWRKGILVCAAPEILYAEDTDGDGKADDVRTLFTGFATHNFQARVNSLEYGLDGWVYGSCGLFGGNITSVPTGEVTALGQRDFRINPDTGALQPASGATQQGRVRNDWDDWFGCNNGAPLMHYPLASHYLQRNPFLAPVQSVVNIAAGPDPGRLFPISSQVLFMLSGPPGRPTAACGLGVYRDDLLGRQYSQNAFTCEPVNNLVHRQILIPQAATFSSRRGDEEPDREFLASDDPWFRPVQVRTGLDGALWVVDMYRYVIEHPIWIPPDTLATLDTRAGSEMGRIYRIRPQTQPARSVVRLDQLSGETLAAAMDSPNGTQRDLVQQLLQWNNDLEAAARLKTLAVESQYPAVRIQALSTLANLHCLDADLVLKLMDDSDPQVRRHAVRTAEPYLHQSSEIATGLLKLTSDADAFVRLQVAYSAGLLPPKQAGEVLASLVLPEDSGVHLLSAVESSLTPENIDDTLQEAVHRSVPQATLNRLRRNGAALAAEPALKQMLTDLAENAVRQKSAAAFLQLASFLDAWRRRPDPGLDRNSPAAIAIWQPVMDVAAEVASRDDADPRLRSAAVAVLAEAAFLGRSRLETLTSLLSPRTPPELQSAVLSALRKDGSDAVPDHVLFGWEAREPLQRRESIALLMSRTEWTRKLLASIREGTVSALELDLSQQQSLLDHAEESIRILAAESFQPRSTAARKEVIERYTLAITEQGDPVKGREVFQKHCVNCHKVQNIGHQVGPDIAGYASKPVQSLLVSVLDPNSAVDPRYQSYVVVLNDGRSLTGLIAEEAASSLTLLAPEGKRETVLRSEVEQIRGTGKSLMPEGFEQNATPEDLNHLWAWFRTQRLPPKSLEGNRPAVVEVPQRGTVVLQASQAEIYGGEITFEQPFQNIGYWHGTDDFVLWRIRAEETREVAVWAEWACDPAAAGNEFQLDGLQPSIRGKVTTTGAWSRYQLTWLGQGLVRSGESEVIIRPGRPVRGALADLRAIHFVTPGGVPLATGMVAQPAGQPDDSKTPEEIAKWLIDDASPAAEREKLIATVLSKAALIVPLMAKDLPQPSGSSEEYRRIPWIWRVAIAVGKNADTQQVRELLRASLPLPGEELLHWQSVVIGGGLINGLSLAGRWPGDEIRQMIDDDKELSAAWNRALELASAMSDDEAVPTGTRYDALRMVALRDMRVSIPQLERYLQKGVHAELQMGAVSGLSDIDDHRAADLLVSACSHLIGHNRKLALEAMVRNPPRCLRLLDAVERKELPKEVLTEDLVNKLKTHPDEAVARRAKSLLQE